MLCRLSRRGWRESSCSSSRGPRFKSHGCELTHPHMHTHTHKLIHPQPSVSSSTIPALSAEQEAGQRVGIKGGRRPRKVDIENQPRLLTKLLQICFERFRNVVSAHSVLLGHLQRTKRIYKRGRWRTRSWNRYILPVGSHKPVNTLPITIPQPPFSSMRSLMSGQLSNMQ